MPSKKIATIHPACVTCGSCLKVCPVSAISIPDGTVAIIHPQRCIGCGRCAQICPANVIEMIDRPPSNF